MLAITASEQITALFEVEDTDGHGRFVTTYDADMDYVLRFTGDHSQRSITIVKSAEQTPAEGYRPLSFDVQHGGWVQ